MKYSQSFKEKVLKRILPPGNESVIAVAKELGVSDVSIYSWRRKLKNGTLGNDANVSPLSRSMTEKLQMILEGSKVSKDKTGEWLRANGLHSEHLHQFEQEIIELVAGKKETEKIVIRELKKENIRLEKELNRKDKTIAELAALITLKKKLNVLWEEREVD
jgi:transposase-like protein